MAGSHVHEDAASPILQRLAEDPLFVVLGVLRRAVPFGQHADDGCGLLIADARSPDAGASCDEREHTRPDGHDHDEARNQHSTNESPPGCELLTISVCTGNAVASLE
jgi:hypothetical protein